MERTRCICGEGDLYVFDRVLDSYSLFSSTGMVEAAVENKALKGTGSNPKKDSGEDAKTQKRKRSPTATYKPRKKPRATTPLPANRSSLSGQPRKRGRPRKVR